MTARPLGERSALAAGLLSYFLWGLLPLLLRAAGEAGAGPWELVSWRTVWAVPFAVGLVAATGGFRATLTALRQPRVLGMLILSATLVGINWSAYIVAVASHRTLEASLGYYINPLLNMAAGALLFRERIDRIGWIAVILATLGVAIQTAAVSGIPWLAFLLAISFCAYGVVRKQVAVDAQTGLLVECLLLMWPAIAYLLWLVPTGAMAFGTSPRADLLLIASGLATVAPLAAFAYAARRLPLTIMGFLQFVAPTMQFMVGAFAFGEPISTLRLVSFVFIWAGAVVFAAGAWAASRRKAATVVA